MSNADRNDYIVAMAEAKREYERYLLASKRSRPNTRVDSKKAAPDAASDAGTADPVAALEAIVPDSMLQEIVNEAIAPEERDAGAPVEPAPTAAEATAPRRSRKKGS